MRRIAWLLLMMILPGCDAQTSQPKSQPVPPDDMSNGPWKNQRRQAGSKQPATETLPPTEPN